MKLIAIAAVGKNREIGLNKDMPWKRSLKKDLQFFKEQTTGHSILMGRNTFESLPGMLPGRKHIVITSRPFVSEGVECYRSIEEFEKACSHLDETIYVIGGGTIYKSLLDACDELLLTEVDQAFEADTYFPSFDPDQYEKIYLGDPYQDAQISCRHVLYKKKSQKEDAMQL